MIALGVVLGVIVVAAVIDGVQSHRRRVRDGGPSFRESFAASRAGAAAWGEDAGRRCADRLWR